MAFFLLASLVMPDASFSDVENRSLQKFPRISVNEYTSGRLEKKLENYVNDQFFGRRAFVKLKSAVSVSAGSVYSNGVWKGKDGYLMEDVTVPTEERMDETIKALTKFKKDNKKIPMRFMLAPTSANIYSEKLPALAATEDQNKYMDEFYSKLESTGVEAVDVRTAFNSAKDDMQLYYRTDHHWTTDGAKLALGELLKSKKVQEKEFELYEVKNDFVGSLAAKSGFTGGKADAIKLAAMKDGKNSAIYYFDTQKKTSKFYKMSNLDKRDAYTVFGGQNHPLYTIKTPTSSNRKLLLVKDSYANCMIPFLTQYYREIVVVDPRYYYDDIDITMLSESVNEVLFLYNANTFFEEDALAMMLK
ncbi:MAG: hypothetical protein KBS56_05590 [Clostridiales bacterium]|nr:hypothetical protein [Candidatus Crickella equi]